MPSSDFLGRLGGSARRALRIFGTLLENRSKPSALRAGWETSRR